MKSAGNVVALHGPRDRDGAVFQRLAQDFQRAAVELGQLVEEQHAVVRRARSRRARAGCRRRPGPASLIVWCGERNGRRAISGWPGARRPTEL